MAKKLLMLLNAPYPADIRVKKEADALISAGFEVHLLCLRKKDQPYEQVFEGIKITRIDAGKNNYELAFWDVMMSINFIHAKFQTAAKALLLKENIKVVHVHDLPLGGTALSLKKKLGLQVVVDLHENYPEALKTWFKWKKNPIVRLKNYLFLNPSRWSEFERRACLESDVVIAVVDEMKERLIQEYNVNPEKIKVVTNTEDKNFLTQALNPEVYKSLEGKFIITYSGGIGPHRGVDTAIKGMQYLKDMPQIQLAIVGFGSPSVMNGLKALVQELQLSNVHFFGFQPFSKFYSYMHLADVNVIPHQSNGHTDNTVPHKLFQGMMAERPLLVSSSAPLKRFVSQYNSGVIFEAGNPADFSEKVKQLYTDKSLRDQLGKNGKEATVSGNLNWETTQKELIDLYDSFY
ncbi:MAG TPA: glycosyltransferase family 4 protein [Cyclobacteriaceae bacterium]|nr:glycosyltransferase family 4 protein [Cyclobacteriaceae bacterium]